MQNEKKGNKTNKKHVNIRKKKLLPHFIVLYQKMIKAELEAKAKQV